MEFDQRMPLQPHIFFGLTGLELVYNTWIS